MTVWLCRWTALHLASNNGHTETAMVLVTAGADVHGKDNDGYGFSRLHARSVGFATVLGGRSVHSGVERQECPFGLCRRTALHSASQNGHTETAMALVKAGADVHCKANDGCGSSGLHRDYVRGGRSVHLGWSCRRACFGCAGSRRCTLRRLTATRRRRWRWSRRARTWAPGPAAGTGSRASSSGRLFS